MRYILTLLTLILSNSMWAINFKTDTIKIDSEILHESRTIIIFKPDDIGINDSVNLLYLLDGEFAEQRFKELITTLPNNKIIGIGIVNTNRNRDMLPVKSPDAFLNFITGELFSRIETSYKVKQRVLFGHSFAGGFTIYAMIHKPELFDRFVASSPTPIMKMVDPVIYKTLDDNLQRKIMFYFSCGSEDMKQVKTWSEILYKNLSGMNFRQLQWQHEIFEGADHNSSDKIAILKIF